VNGLLQAGFVAVLLLAQALPVEKVVVKGASARSEAEIVEAAGVAVGVAADKAAVAAAAERLMRTGWFERVKYHLQPGPDGVLVTFTVVERSEVVLEAEERAQRPKIASVTFTGTQAAPAGRLWAAVRGVLEGREYEEEDFRHILESLLRPVFGERGVWRVEFGAIKVEGVDPVHLSVAVEEGPALKLAGVRLKGGTEAWVEEARFPVGLTANRKRVEEAVIRLRHRMAREGYLRGSVTTVERVEGEELWLELGLEPGTRFTFGALRIRGLEAEGEARARKLWTAAPGAVASPEVVERWIAAVFAAGIPPGRDVRREFVHREGEAVVDVEVEFPR
jgi:outer membrane protein assembly factor BamA